MRYKIARKLAAFDGVELQDIRSTVGPEEDANNWRKYLGRADDVIALICADDASFIVDENDNKGWIIP